MWTGPPTPRLLITDFDGTLTRFDFFECVLRHCRSPSSLDAWQRFEAGQLTHLEALREIFATLPSDEALVMKLARQTQLDPRLPQAVSRLERHGWGVVVVSAGCDWYIERLLREAGVALPVIANPGELRPGQGLYLTAPAGSPFFHPETGIDKAAVVRAACPAYQQIAFAGNGRADLEAARMVAPDLRFATDWLAEQLRQLGESFCPFHIWSEIAEHLVQ